MKMSMRMLKLKFMKEQNKINSRFQYQKKLIKVHQRIVKIKHQ